VDTSVAPPGLAAICPDLGSINRFVDLLAGSGVERGLIGPRETQRLWDRHIVNSLAVVDLIPEGSDVVDVGSGAGLPGLPVAIARPDLSLTLLEPLLRRSTFLIEVVDVLGLADRVRVVRARAEDHRGQYDLALARAVAPLPRLLGWCLPLLRRAGTLLALKGRSAEEEVAAAWAELAAARRVAEVLEVRALPEAEMTRVVRVR
jgi:16S rRNA (guanine527-N7)-methyltransferase